MNIALMILIPIIVIVIIGYFCVKKIMHYKTIISCLYKTIYEQDEKLKRYDQLFNNQAKTIFKFTKGE